MKLIVNSDHIQKFYSIAGVGGLEGLLSQTRKLNRKPLTRTMLNE